MLVPPRLERLAPPPATATALPPLPTVAPPPPTAPSQADVLVDTGWVKEHVRVPGVRLIGESGGQNSYDAVHLPGAW